jgi:hypothetical protein
MSSYNLRNEEPRQKRRGRYEGVHTSHYLEIKDTGVDFFNHSIPLQKQFDSGTFV